MKLINKPTYIKAFSKGNKILKGLSGLDTARDNFLNGDMSVKDYFRAFKTENNLYDTPTTKPSKSAPTLDNFERYKKKNLSTVTNPVARNRVLPSPREEAVVNEMFAPAVDSALKEAEAYKQELARLRTPRQFGDYRSPIKWEEQAQALKFDNRAEVAAYQRWAGLKSDGAAGKATQAKLKEKGYSLQDFRNRNNLVGPVANNSGPNYNLSDAIAIPLLGATPSTEPVVTWQSERGLTFPEKSGDRERAIPFKVRINGLDVINWYYPDRAVSESSSTPPPIVNLEEAAKLDHPLDFFRR